MFGVFLAYMYHFNRGGFENFFLKYKYYIIPAGLLFISSCFFFKINSMFMNTIGLTLLYLGFGSLMAVIMADKDIDPKLDKIFGKIPVNIISRIGFYSYSIYLWHVFVIKYVMVCIYRIISFEIPGNLLNFLIYFFLSIFMGIGMSRLIEINFLKFRDKHFPSRAKAKLLEPETIITPALIPAQEGQV